MASNLDNLVTAGLLKVEAAAKDEFDGLVQSGNKQLKDAELEGLSLEGRFALAYNAAHAFALAALRASGYRPNNNRQVVFQCTPTTLKLSNTQMRILDDAHRKRNNSAYEGITDVSEGLVVALLRVVREMKELVVGINIT